MIDTIETERELLGAILLNPPTIEDVDDRLMKYHFRDEVNAAVFGVIGAAYEQEGVFCTPITICDHAYGSRILRGREPAILLASLATKINEPVDLQKAADIIIAEWEAHNPRPANDDYTY